MLLENGNWGIYINKKSNSINIQVTSLPQSYNPQNDQILSTIIHQIVKAADPDKIILFGSRAKGTQREDSDYDICVLKRCVKKRRNMVKKIYCKLDILASVDIVANTPSRFDEIKKSPFLIYDDIDKYGKIVYEK